MTEPEGPEELPSGAAEGVPGTFGTGEEADITAAAYDEAPASSASAGEDPFDDPAAGASPSPGAHAAADGLRALDPAALPPLRAALEAVLLVTDEPVPAVTLAQVTERPTDEVETTLLQLAQDYRDGDRGFELRNVAGGWRLYTRPDCAPYVERFVLDGQSARLTQAALETLAVIAYRQPVTRSRVSAVRGVNVDGVVRTLLARGLITESGQDEDTGGVLYRTTPMLLERLGLQSLEELPSLAPLLPELDELDSAQPST
jgi:segregation and condensation protein B